jgi:two-component system, OmpR family, KDP operon response regulator KdpE
MRVYTYIYTLDAAELHRLTAMLQEGGLHVYADPGLDWLLEYASTITVQLIVLSLAHELLIEAVRQLRIVSQAPIVALCTVQSEEEQLALYKVGATFVWDRWYNPRLLLAQIKAVTQLAKQAPALLPATMQTTQWRVDAQWRKVLVPGGTAISLTAKEFELFALLWKHRGQVLTTEQIIEAAWGYTGCGDKNMLRNLIRRLRAKIEPYPNRPQFILTNQTSGISSLQMVKRSITVDTPFREA